MRCCAARTAPPASTGQGHRDRLCAAAVADIRLRSLGLAAAGDEVCVRKPELYTGADDQRAAAAVDPRPADAHLHPVSFFHGSNDGQKGMGLIMLILIGVAPTAYALNRALPAGHTATFIAASDAAAKIIDAHGAGFADPRRPAPSGDRLRPRARDLGRHLSLARGAGEADCRPGAAIWLARQGARRQGSERPQRHVSRLRGSAHPGQGQGNRS